MKQKPTAQAFTLVELLVVISIIAILAGLLLPAVIGAFTKATEAQARSEVKSIEMAVKAYLNEYNRFPEINTSDIVYGEGSKDNGFLIGVLRGTNVQLNARRIVFLEVQDKSILNGNLVDPWDNQYRIAVDTSYDNVVQTGASGIGNLAGRNVAVWSYGVNGSGTNSLIKSW